MKNNRLVKKLLGIPELTVSIIVLLSILVLSLVTPYFLTSSNILTLLTGLATDGIIVIGMTMVLIIGMIDLSVGSIMGMVCMIVATLTKAGVNVWIAAVIGFVIGVLCGAINGILIGKYKLNNFITTFAMQSILAGVTLLASQGKSISPKADSPGYAAFKFIGQGDILGIPMIVIVLFVFIIIGDLLLRKFTKFRELYYIGSNTRAAEVSGINVEKTILSVYMISAALASIAGIISLSRFGASTPTTGVDAPMSAISAAVIGGASLNGGAGTVLGAFLGVILINIIDNGLILLNVSVYGRDLISGLLLMVAIIADRISNSKKSKSL